jgi:DNA-binding transcriptional MerR regulator
MEKIYYSISEVAKIMDVTIPTLRFWEREFPQLKPHVTSGGTRKYKQKDIDLIRTIKYLLKEQHLTIEGARTRLKMPDNDADTKAQVVERLSELRSELIEIRKELNATGAMEEDTFVD